MVGQISMKTLVPSTLTGRDLRLMQARAQSFACAMVEGAVVLGTFDLEVHNQPARQMHPFMAVVTTFGMECIFWAAVDTETKPTVVKADQLFKFDVVCRASADPVCYGLYFQFLQWIRRAEERSARPSAFRRAQTWRVRGRRKRCGGEVAASGMCQVTWGARPS